MEIDLLSFSNNHIDLKLKEVIENKLWRFIGFYGYSEENKKTLSWNLMSLLKTHNNLPWLCVGDFNEILLDTEKKGSVDRRSHVVQNFIDVLNQCNFQDLGYTGYPFTWTNRREGEENIQERFNHFLAYETWRCLYEGVKMWRDYKDGEGT